MGSKSCEKIHKGFTDKNIFLPDLLMQNLEM